MKRIDTPTKATDLHGPGKHGFKDGNPLNGDPPTTLNAGMFNHFQEEIARAVEAGGQALDATNFAQLAFVLGLGECSLGPIGYLTLPGNATGRVLVQWGSQSVVGGGSVAVEFPKHFLTAPWQIFCGAYITAPQTTPITYAATIRDNTYFDFRNLSSSPLNAGWWLAIGI